MPNPKPLSPILLLSSLVGLAALLPGQNTPPAQDPPPRDPPQQGPPGQDPPPPPEPPQDPDLIVVTATRFGQDPFDLPYSTATITDQRVREQMQSRTTPEMLAEVPGISLQKTAHGQGSPKFRGQTGFQTLLLVDGIRINDSTWRSGNVEYWNHLDPYSFERFEVLLGPAAVLWGSDAVAGVGQAFSRRNTSWEPGIHVHGRTLARYATAEDSFVAHAETHGNIDDDFGWHFGISYKDFGDLQAGEGVGNLGYTGYDEADGDAVLTWNVSEQNTLSMGGQLNHLRNVPRTHSTVQSEPWRGTTRGSDLEREHDHRRQLYFLELQSVDGNFFENFVGTLSYKDRYERQTRLRTNLQQQIDSLDVKTMGALAQFDTELGDGTLVWGGDYYHDFVDSDFRELNVNGSVIETRNRGVVAGNADYDLVGAYAQYSFPVHDRVEVIAGVRYNYVRLDASDVDVPGDNVFFDDVTDSWHAPTANLRAIWDPADEVRIYGGFSQGFRAPNLSDTTRFDVARTNEQEVPASGLDPEDYYTFEVGSRYQDEVVFAGAAGWITIVRNQISRFRTGNTVGGLPEVSKANIGDGYYAGFELQGSLALSCLSRDLDELSLYGSFDYVSGRIDQIDDAGVEINDRPKAMPPPSGVIGLRWQHPELNRGAEVFSRMAYHVKPGRYTEEDANNTQRIPPDGLPGWATLNIRAWSEITDHVTVSVAAENLTDVDYRIMDSGLNEPGTNLIVTVEAAF